ncbi:hypothetical protein BEWA_042680 [Theileria equi strain WA]|uniref:START domain-containing protein n=1 Tax=Theileria equi strain WA TaxID=1537102 RepID=L1LG41_THEEQ|nr:hypothetical protein BEWA_042680 [Theileria equi strain WA]EKX74230.1 hypothetical protein BEWA_042680 [Theileria equi strain WA]|eukprot:XP_004833682.1 hypothetical protein BEWA_042680 [Theileria equi strain WA]
MTTEGAQAGVDEHGSVHTVEDCTSQLSKVSITEGEGIANSSGVECNGSVSGKQVKLPANLEDVSGLDPEIVERAFLLFIDRSNASAKHAIYETRNTLADKIICNIFKKLHDIYAKEDERHDFADLLDKQRYFPLMNLEANIPASVPESIVTKLREIANDTAYRHNLVERLLVLDALTLFNIQELRTSCETFRQPIIGELWPVSLKLTLEPKSEEPELPKQDATAKPASFHGQLDGTYVNFKPVNADELSEEEEEEEVSPFSDDFKVEKSPDIVSNISKAVGYKSISKMFSSGSKKLFKQINKLKVKNEEEGWVREPHKNLETVYRMENDIITIKLRGKLPYDLLKILTIINETEFSSAWVPFVKDASDLHAYTKTSKLIYQKCDYPIMGHKETVLYGLSTNILEEANCVVIACRNPPNTQGEFEKFGRILKKGGIPDTGKVISRDGDDYKFLDHVMEKFSAKTYQRGQEICFVLFPAGEHTILEFYLNIILEAKIPMSFVKFIVKKVASGMYKKIAQQGKRFDDGQFTECIRKRREFYSWMEKIYEDYKAVHEKDNKEKFKHMSTYDPNQEL